MADMLDYLSLRGDIPLEAVPFSDADCLVLSELAYTDFPADEPCLIGELCRRRLRVTEAVKNSGAKQRVLHYKKDERLLTQLAESRRFAPLMLGFFEKHSGRIREEQFAAMTVFLPDSTAACVFRGTDWSLVGWKEDFNMAYREVLPAQERARSYVERIGGIHRGELRLMGHSKGGNLAVYAAACCSDEIRDRICDIVSLDGPGFCGEVRKTDGFAGIEGRVRTFMPSSSIVGALFSRTGTVTVIESRGVGLMQHIPYNWQVMGGGFVPVPEELSHGLLLGDALNEWLYSHTAEERKRLIDALWTVVSGSGARELFDLFDGKRARSVIKSCASLGKAERRMLTELFFTLYSARKKRR